MSSSGRPSARAERASDAGGREGARWLIYALGGGLGHLTRAVALARAASRRGHEARIVTNTLYAGCLPLDAVLGAPGRVIRIDPGAGRERVRALLPRIVAEERPDVLCVDTFPRGLAGELRAVLAARPGPRRVLVHRDIAPSYVRWADLPAFVDASYDAIVLPGEPAPLGDHPRACATEAPWLVRDRGELLDRDAARARLRVRDAGRRVVAVLGCGRPEEVRDMAVLASRLALALGDRAAVRFVSPLPVRGLSGRVEALRLWPLLDAMAGVDVLLGAGGYNTVHEARVTATPFFALARARRYDRQAVRLRSAERVAGHDEAVAAVSAALARRRAPRAVPAYENGAHEAVRLIEQTAAAGEPLGADA